jgi:hypothetical protein
VPSFQVPFGLATCQAPLVSDPSLATVHEPAPLSKSLLTVVAVLLATYAE